jgi:hypothetical protein
MLLSPFCAVLRYTRPRRKAKIEVSMRNRELRILVCLFLSGVCACAQDSARTQRLAGQVSALDQLLASRPAGDPQTGALLNERSTLLRELIAADPARALAVALDSSGQWTGTASAIIEDDFVNGRSRTVWELATEEGTFEMYFAGRAPRASSSKVTIPGLRAGNRIAVAGIVEEAPVASPQCTTIGPQKIAVLMVTMPGNPAFPADYTPAAVYEKFFGPATGDLRTESVNSLWQQMSDGQASATGEVFGPFRLGQDFTCDDRSALKAAAISAADPTVDFTQFNRIALLYPVRSCSTNLGYSTMGCSIVSTPSKGDLFASFAWLGVAPPINQLSTSVHFYTHELGHSLGLGHATSDDYGNVPLGPLADSGTIDAYGDPFSNMGNWWLSPYTGLPLTGQYSAQHKRLWLNWLPASSVQEVQASGTFSIAPFETSSGVRALRILRDAASGAWLWAEFRLPVGSIDGSLSLWRDLPANRYLQWRAHSLRGPGARPLAHIPPEVQSLDGRLPLSELDTRAGADLVRSVLAANAASDEHELERLVDDRRLRQALCHPCLVVYGLPIHGRLRLDCRLGPSYVFVDGFHSGRLDRVDRDDFRARGRGGQLHRIA